MSAKKPLTPKGKADPTPVKTSIIAPVPDGSALWFAREMAKVSGYDVAKPVGQDLLAIGVRMSEADRLQLVKIMKGAQK